MREISFRGRRKDTGEWTFGYLFTIWEQAYILWGTTNGIPNMVEVIPETVGQHTGLKDKNGKDIYEGDIVQCVSERTLWSIGEEPLRVMIRSYAVIFKDAKFQWMHRLSEKFGSTELCFDFYCEGNDVEVIGDIHEGVTE